MAKTFDEMKQRLAKHIRGMVVRVADDIKDLEKRELFKNSVLGAAHEEPGTHEPQAVGTPAHMEPGDHESFTMDAPPSPDTGASTSQPIVGGMGVPEAQLQNEPNGGDMCPLCGKPDMPGSCVCLDNAVLKSEDLRKFLSPALGTMNGPGQIAGPTPAAPMGPMTPMGGAGPSSPASPAGTPGSLQLSEEPAVKGEMCKGCGEMHKAGAACMSKDEVDGRNKVSTKKQPMPNAPGAKMPPEAPKKVKSQDDNKVKANPLGKGAVPEAKPPSGKTPGGPAGATPPMASNTSKPGLNKDDIASQQLMAPKPGVVKEELDKAALNPQMQQHALIDASRQAAAKPAVPPVAAPRPPTLTHPSDMSRANAYSAAQAGAFQPAGPVKSGLQLQGPPKGIREPNPTGAQPVKSAGSPFGKGEKCAFCQKDEHSGECER